MWKEFEEVTQTKKESLTSETDQLNALIGDKFQPKESDEKDGFAWRTYRKVVMIAMMVITEAMNRRRGSKNSRKVSSSFGERSALLHYWPQLLNIGELV